MKAQTQAVRSEVVRGVRWGAILLLTVLLGLAGYRMLSSSPAVAATPKAPVLADDAPVIEVQTDPGTILAEPDAAGARPVVRTRTGVRTRADESVPPPPPIGKRFDAAPTAAPAPRTVEIAEPLPEAEAVTVDAQLPAPVGNGKLAPPPPGKPGTPAKIVKSVGRIFGIGKKENQDNGGK